VKLSTPELAELAQLAIAAARTAGEMIAESRPHEIEQKSSGTSLASQVVTEIDRRSEDIILGHLRPSIERFDLGLLTEERTDDGGRLHKDFFWCIDPLDGTLPFIQGEPGYAVSIALVAQDGTPWIGVVYDPVSATLLHVVKDAGAFQDSQPWPSQAQNSQERLTVFADRSFRERDDYAAITRGLQQIADDLGLSGVDMRPTRGAVMNACGVLGNAPACYFKEPKPAGGGSLWDFAATACLFNEVGAVATDMHGEPLDLNRADSTFMHHRGVLFASDDALAEQIRALR
jgi:fructose-1,6-bisphosphatase/inositol monophosphatase family enzyme